MARTEAEASKLVLFAFSSTRPTRSKQGGKTFTFFFRLKRKEKKKGSVKVSKVRSRETRARKTCTEWPSTWATDATFLVAMVSRSSLATSKVSPFEVFCCRRECPWSIPTRQRSVGPASLVGHPEHVSAFCSGKGPIT